MCIAQLRSHDLLILSLLYIFFVHNIITISELPYEFHYANPSLIFISLIMLMPGTLIRMGHGWRMAVHTKGIANYHIPIHVPIFSLYHSFPLSFSFWGDRHILLSLFLSLH